LFNARTLAVTILPSSANQSHRRIVMNPNPLAHLSVFEEYPFWDNGDFMKQIGLAK
jgi:hypothetical protein